MLHSSTKDLVESAVVPPRPTAAQLQAARNKLLDDVIAPQLRVLFVGINPGLYSAAVGHNFGRPGNRFWPTLARSGFTPRQLSPFEERELLAYGLGITNVVARATARADELSPDELRAGAANLERKVRQFQPSAVAMLGVSAYRVAFEQPRAQIGAQNQLLAGARLWVLPNPSGLNAHYQLPELERHFAELRQAVI
jgi:TDG/mug DNA glycosylase family protein